MLLKRVGLCACITCLLGICGCERDISGNGYSESSVGEVSSTYVGVIVNMRQVTIKGHEKLSDNAIGGVIGGVAGGALGNTIGRGTGRTLATTTGALAGMTAGAMLEDRLSRSTGIEYIVKVADTGGLYTVVQGKDTIYSVGQKVYLSVSASGRSRIISAAN